MFFIEPDHLAFVARIFIGRFTLNHIAAHLIEHLTPQIFVSVFIHFLRTDVLKSKFAAHKWPRFIFGTNTLNPLEGGQINPLVIRLQRVRPSQYGGTFNISGPIKDRQGFITIPSDFHISDTQMTNTFMPPPIA
ncbi:hypothetical protein THIOM_004534 [Candidatus Thiomargarita nelsonii]|uniref:Uncharacterized protein n=1 Tax=Candidatus Thiomargarita nelsonii TaxID=1003181 RepID=A0A176RVQ2_9GAMM|nr:hypothetical protein THIOM_004534 [Candidatus Thiomargarita nelsonii]